MAVTQAAQSSRQIWAIEIAIDQTASNALCMAALADAQSSGHQLALHIIHVMTVLPASSSRPAMRVSQADKSTLARQEALLCSTVLQPFLDQFQSQNILEVSAHVEPNDRREVGLCEAVAKLSVTKLYISARKSMMKKKLGKTAEYCFENLPPYCRLEVYQAGKRVQVRPATAGPPPFPTPNQRLSSPRGGELSRQSSQASLADNTPLAFVPSSPGSPQVVAQHSGPQPGPGPYMLFQSNGQFDSGRSSLEGSRTSSLSRYSHDPNVASASNDSSEGVSGPPSGGFYRGKGLSPHGPSGGRVNHATHQSHTSGSFESAGTSGIVSLPGGGDHTDSGRWSPSAPPLVPPGLMYGDSHGSGENGQYTAARWQALESQRWPSNPNHTPETLPTGQRLGYEPGPISRSNSERAWETGPLSGFGPKAGPDMDQRFLRYDSSAAGSSSESSPATSFRGQVSDPHVLPHLSGPPSSSQGGGSRAQLGWLPHGGPSQAASPPEGAQCRGGPQDLPQRENGGPGPEQARQQAWAGGETSGAQPQTWSPSHSSGEGSWSPSRSNDKGRANDQGGSDTGALSHWGRTLSNGSSSPGSSMRGGPAALGRSESCDNGVRGSRETQPHQEEEEEEMAGRLGEPRPGFQSPSQLQPPPVQQLSQRDPAAAPASVAMPDLSGLMMELSRIQSVVASAQLATQQAQRMAEAAQEESRRAVEAKAMAEQRRGEAEAEAQRALQQAAAESQRAAAAQAEARAAMEAAAFASASLAKAQEEYAQERERTKEFRKYTEAELSAACEGFSAERVIGEGAFGTVYKGMLARTPVAIKRIKNSDLAKALTEFKKELEVHAGLRHPHLVLLMGHCLAPPCLVYECLPQGSLYDRLTAKDGTPPLPWHVRFDIFQNVYQAILYLHRREPPIIHLDIKPANILLDKNLTAKVGDVGLSQFMLNVDPQKSYIQQSSVVGTIGYVDPHYGRSGQFSSASDVFSLGQVLWDLLVGIKVVGKAAGSGGQAIEDLEEAALSGNMEELLALLDPTAGSWPAGVALQLCQLASKCCSYRRKDRPDLEREVMETLDAMREEVERVKGEGQQQTSKLKEGKDEAIHAAFICPITQEVMEWPVIAADGFTYERHAIEQWLATHNTSPMTNQRLSSKQLVPNNTLRSMVMEWKGSADGRELE